MVGKRAEGFSWVAAMRGLCKGIGAAALASSAALGTVAALGGEAQAGSVDVTTYHYDVERTGWNPAETALNWANVGSKQFGLLKSIPLDEQVDAQALVISSATLAAKGLKGYPNDLVYVATENNTIYAIDSVTGAVEFKRNLGTPVSESTLPSGCANNSVVIGIASTPVIDLPNGLMYVIAATVEGGAAVYRIHELSIANFADVVPSVVISASHALSDGTVTKFKPAAERQRPGLLLANGAVYAGFGSYCDQDTDISRGWLLGWHAGTLKPMPDAVLVDRQTVAQSGDYFLSAIWMSGYGLSADAAGDVYLLTGNSNQLRPDNLQESAIRVAPGLADLLSYFTPANFAYLDSQDLDFGSGGVMVAPDRAGRPHFAVGGGKDGRLFLYDRDAMGGFTANGPDAAPSVYQGPCWCGPSYFVGSDGKERVVSSGGLNASTWFLPTTKRTPLVADATSPTLPTTDQEQGFMTTVSSDGTHPKTAIIWAQNHASGGSVSLYAFATSPGLPLLYSGISGAWPHLYANANIVPVVASGKVFVPSYKELDIFGLISKTEAEAPTQSQPATVAVAEITGPQYFGRIVSLDANGRSLTLELRTGLHLDVDAAAAIADHKSVVLFRDEIVEVKGTPRLDGPFAATGILHAKDSQASWGPDVP